VDSTLYYNIIIMCLTLYRPTLSSRTSWTSKGIIKVFGREAESDVEVFKMFDVDMRGRDYYLVSPYMRAEVDSESIMTADILPKIVDSSVAEINEGIHSFKDLKTASDCCYLDMCRVALRCIIPKGTLYFASDDEVVSEVLYITNEVLSASSARRSYITQAIRRLKLKVV
jgi:hypothetical protein